MLLKRLIFGTVLPCLLVSVAMPAFAAARRAARAPEAVDGVAAIHAISREGNRNCFKDHWHYGTSISLPSERIAQAAAIKSWSDFVAIEYGDDWAVFPKASDKQMKCSKAPAGWSCDLSARPCR